MKNIKVVIGSNLGDEGKGLVTEYLSRNAKGGIVVRFNGGCQAGHTVVTSKGHRHVFGSFGCGTLRGLPTYLGKYFIVNPRRVLKEYSDLVKITPNISLLVDKNCLITTPYDIILNQIKEFDRGDKRHGSCGFGIHETIVRSHIDDYKIEVNDIYDKVSLEKKMRLIKDKHMTYKIKDFGIKEIPEWATKLLEDDGVIRRFLLDIEELKKISLTVDSSCLDDYNHIIFEGAQGLLLDQNHENFPHVTHSNTGISNVVELIKERNYLDGDIEIVYVTRPYLTRHGAGPLPYELDIKPYSKIVDLTNVYNEFQGKLRYALLDINYFKKMIARDLEKAKGLPYNVSLAVTCLDHLDGEISFVEDEKQEVLDISRFVEVLSKYIGADKAYTSFSDDGERVVVVDKFRNS
jgi:adenylosuccinate synthase